MNLLDLLAAARTRGPLFSPASWCRALASAHDGRLPPCACRACRRRDAAEQTVTRRNVVPTIRAFELPLTTPGQLRVRDADASGQVRATVRCSLIERGISPGAAEQCGDAAMRRFWETQRDRDRRTLVVASSHERVRAAVEALDLPASARCLTTDGLGSRGIEGLLFERVVWVDGYWRGVSASYVEQLVQRSAGKRAPGVVQHVHLDPLV